MFILPLCVAGQFGPTRFVHDWYMHFIAKVVQEYYFKIYEEINPETVQIKNMFLDSDPIMLISDD